MRSLIGHLRVNLVAYVALFAVLGGTSYAVGPGAPPQKLKVTVRNSVAVKVSPGGLATVVASCRPGERATGGGNANTGNAATAIMVMSSQPAFKGNPAQAGQIANGWIVTIDNVSNFGGGTGSEASITAQVVCVPA